VAWQAHRPGSRHGFTLLEALVSLVIFTVITFALSFALSSVLRSYSVSKQRQEEAATARALFGSLSRDLQAAFVSRNNAACLFLTQQTGGSTGNGISLTFSTLARRIESDVPLGSGALDTSGAAVNPTAGMAPQSNIEIVRYDFDPGQGVVRRLGSPVPNIQVLNQPDLSPSTIVAQNIVALNLRFWDATAQTWRTEWQYQPRDPAQEQANLPGMTDPTGTGATGGGLSAEPDGDTTLPGFVEITLVLGRNDGTTQTYATTIPVVTPQPLDIRPPAAQTPTAPGGGQPGGG
jgi:prepilin-type N-terminal cleavage/methylation domain-containing protein